MLRRSGVFYRRGWAAQARAGTNTAGSAPFDIDAFNRAADNPLSRTGSKGAAVVRAQILLDCAWYSSGEIDGRFAANMQRMVRVYQAAHGLKTTGTDA